MHAYLNTATQIARRLGSYLMREFDKLHPENSTKTNVFDLKKHAEYQLTESIKEVYPSHEVCTYLPEEQNDQPVWYIDALNGLDNFEHGVPHFAIAMGIMINQRMEHALIHDPMLDETFTVTRGTQPVMKQQRLRITLRKNQNSIFLASNTPLDIPNIVLRSTGCNALMLAYTAGGRYDAFAGTGLSQLEQGMGKLFIQAAGGLCTDFKGEELFNNQDFLGADKKLMKGLIKALGLVK